MRRLLNSVVLVGCLAGGTAVAAPPRAILLDGDGLWRDANWRRAAQEFKLLLTEAGYEVQTVAPPELTRELAATLIAVPSLERLPRTAFEALTSFVGAASAGARGNAFRTSGGGGHLLASGGEPFRQALYLNSKGEWIAEEDLLGAVRPQRIIFEPADASALERFTNQNDPPPVRFATPGPDGFNNALTVTHQHLSGEGKPSSFQGYDLLCLRPFTASPFASGQNLTVITVRGTPGQVLAVRWEETDGSRWVAQVPLTAEWKTHGLMPSDFQVVYPAMEFGAEDRFWVPQPRTRLGSPYRRDGNPFVAFDPGGARSLSFGVSTGMGAQPGAVEYSIGPIGIGSAPIAERFQAPFIEGLSPWYQQFPKERGGEKVRVPQPMPRNLAGTQTGRARYQTVGALLDPLATRRITESGSAVIWLPSPVIQSSERAKVVELLRGDATGVALLGGGPAQAAVVPGEPIPLRARLMNASRAPQQMAVTWAVRRGADVVATQRASLRLEAGDNAAIAAPEAASLPLGDYRVETVLALGEDVCDRVESPLRVFDPVATRDPSKRVRVVDGHFSVAGKRIFLFGSNYRLNFSPDSYDTELVESDLSTMEKLGMNVLSVSAGSGEGAAGSLMDLLERCRRHNIWAHISIRAASYVTSPNGRFEPEAVRRTLMSARLPGNDRVFAYDLAWEPKFGGYQERRSRDAQWRKWVADQYGTLEAAERAWGVPAPKDNDDLLTNPEDQQFRIDGPHRVLMAAYRRFEDDFISREYGKVTRFIKTIDPDVLLGFRTLGWNTLVWESWSGTASTDRELGFDLASAAGHLDMTGPEGYGQPADAVAGRKWGVITSYARMVSNGKPVSYPEFGGLVGARGGTPEENRRQNALVEGMMRSVAESDADCVLVWWWTGWQPIETSDYGITDSSRTPRASARTLADWGKRINERNTLAGRGEPVLIRIDRDADARGAFAIREQHTEEYLKAKDLGRPVKFVTAGTGSTTATMPLVQIGNVPFKGSGPLKYANAEIANIRVTWQGGEAAVENGGEVRVPAGQKIQVRVELFNSGEVAWVGARTAQRPGDCFFKTSAGPLPLPENTGVFQTSVAEPITVETGQNPVEITGRVEALERGSFGEVLQVRLIPEHAVSALSQASRK
jgi:hypothetical protein